MGRREREGERMCQGRNAGELALGMGDDVDKYGVCERERETS